MKTLKRSKLAFVSDEGTAAAETCLCQNHMSEQNVNKMFYIAVLSGDLDTKGMVAVDENDECSCVICGYR